MNHSISEELYSEALKLSKRGLGPNSQTYPDQSGSCDKELDNLSNDDDGSFWDGPEEHNSQSDLNREWQKRRDQFHTIGYRDGLAAGKEASAQEGFNKGFKESVLVGYKWGLVRGVTSAFSCLPDGLREKLVESQEERDKLQSLYKSVHSLSTKDALIAFHDGFVAKKVAEASDDVASSKDESSEILQSYSEELKSLISKTPKIEVSFMVGESA